jgi:uncharacterized protein (TIGR03083 family)
VTRESGFAIEAMRDEAVAFSGALRALGGADWARPTRCAPWTVRELAGHVRVAVGRLPDMLRAPAPERAEVTAAGYYRPDARFSAEGNAARVATARDFAAEHDVNGGGLAADFAAVSQRAYELCRDEAAGRVVRTRHGDAMLLSEFLLTRVVEVAVHGLDVADAVGREPWLTASAEAAVLGLVMGPDWQAYARELGWDGAIAVRKVTGRAVLTDVERGLIDRAGAGWITLG